MALLRIEGFDHQNTITDTLADTGAFAFRNGFAFTIETAVVGAGKCVVLDLLGPYIGGVLTTPLTTGFWGMSTYIPSSAITDLFQVVVWNSATQNPYGGSPDAQVAVQFNPVNGVISVYRGTLASGTLLASSANNSFTVNAAAYIEISVTISTTIGGVAVYIDGINKLSIAGVNTAKDGGTVFDSVAWGAQPSGGSRGTGCKLDHFYICDTSAGPGANPFNTLQGPSFVYTQFPSGAGSSTQFTPLASTNYSQVQETAMDSDTTYNYSGTMTNEDLFTIDALAAGVIPTAVQISGAYRQDNAGVRAIANHIKSSSTDTTGTARTCDLTYTYQHDLYVLDPNGSVAWTNSSVSALEIGYEVTT